VLVLTGNELSPTEISAPAGIEVRGYVPHDAVLPGAALAITHAGTGTLLAAFAAGVPVVALPLGRDQPANARRTVELGLGCALAPEATSAQISTAVSRTLADSKSMPESPHSPKRFIPTTAARAIEAVEQVALDN
jgi:UDP:flavonoid glycosyltransferase YjiC (YdhE family)